MDGMIQTNVTDVEIGQLTNQIMMEKKENKLAKEYVKTLKNATLLKTYLKKIEKKEVKNV